MRLVRLFLALVMAGIGAEAACAQYTPVTASSLSMGSSPITQGRVTFVPVTSGGAPQAYTVNGAGLTVPVGGFGANLGATCNISNGAIVGTCRVADSTMTLPAGLLYSAVICDTSTGNATSGKCYTLPSIPNISGPSWALDQYGPNSAASTAAAFTLTQGSGAPSGPCSGPSLYADMSLPASVTLYACKNGAWAPAGAGNVTITGGGAVSPSSVVAALSGASLTGPLSLSGDPTLSLQAVTKRYVDNVAAPVTLPNGTAARSVFAPGFTYATSYNAYGDSITCGKGLPGGTCPLLSSGQTGPSTPSPYAYPFVHAASLNIPASAVNVRGLSGDQACDIWARQLGPAGDNPNSPGSPAYSVMIGTNDSGIKFPGAYEATFNQCQQGVLGWLAVPNRLKLLPGSAAITSSGTINTVANNAGTLFSVMVTGAQGSEIDIATNLQQPGPVLIYRFLGDGFNGTWTWGVDHVVGGTGTTAPPVPMATQNGTTSSMALLVVPNVPAGAHQINIIQTSTGGSGFGLYGVGIPPANPMYAMPTVTVMDIPLGAPGQVVNTYAPPYNLDIANNVALLAGMGLDVRFKSNRTYMLATAPEVQSDGVHPTQLGQVNIAAALDAGFEATPLALQSSSTAASALSSSDTIQATQTNTAHDIVNFHATGAFAFMDLTEDGSGTKLRLGAYSDGTEYVQGTGAIKFTAIGSTTPAATLSLAGASAGLLSVGSLDVTGFQPTQISVPAGNAAVVGLDVGMVNSTGGHVANEHFWVRDVGQVMSGVTGLQLTSANDGGTVFEYMDIEASTLNLGGNAGATVLIPQLKSTSGTRYLCVGTAGTVTSSVSPCSGS